MFNYFRKELDWAGASSCSKPARSPARPMARCSASLWRHHRAVHRRRRPLRPARPGLFPLTVKLPGKGVRRRPHPGGFFKREGRPAKKNLVSRLIDRPIRPLFPDGFRNEVQIVATVLSHDLENDPDVVAMIGCSRR